MKRLNRKPLKQKKDFSIKGKASKVPVFRQVILIAFVCAFSSGQVFAQNAAQLPAQNAAQLPAQNAAQLPALESGLGSSLEAEIQNMEKSVSAAGITPAQKHDALVRLARLRQLSGDIEGAAKNWLEAAAAIPGQVDDEALLSCAYCLAAMGEWNRAATALEPIVSKLPRARFLDLSIKAIISGDTSNLAVIVEHPNYYEIKTEILFVLWKVSRGNSGEKWRQRLAAEFPQTPEGQLALGLSSSSISIRPSPFWLFASGLDSLPLAETKPVGSSAQNAAQLPAQNAAQLPKQPTTQTQRTAPTVTIAQAIPEDQAAPAIKSSASASQAQASQQSSSSSTKLQTGVFSRQENAQAQTDKLKSAGFSPTIERRVVNNSEMWAVTVPAGNNQTQTVNALRAAGFDSFPIK
jgi:cell division septation protein DedD